ncbi:MAG: HAMP domain-containing sensor histidine kinase [Polyangiaceae bacterium]
MSGERVARKGSRLQVRLFLTFVLAIVLAVVVTVVIAPMFRPDESGPPLRRTARTLRTKLEASWDDPAASDMHIRRVREATGLDVVLHRDVSKLPPDMRFGRRRDGVAFHNGNAYIPIEKNDVLVAFVELREDRAPVPWPPIVGLGCAVVVLAFAARGIAARFAAPLERVAQAATRFGDGDLASRAGTGPSDPEEVGAVAASFDAMASRIEQVVRDQRTLLAAISHELRSPIGRAHVALEIAREKEDSAALATVDRELTTLNTILSDLMASARSGLADLTIESFDLGAMLRKRLTEEPVPPIIELVVDGAVPVKADSALVWRAVANLLSNARVHGHDPNAPIVLTVQTSDGVPTISVRDAGQGFPSDILDKAFQPFVRGSVARTPQAASQSTGLGLALVLRIAEAHGGKAFAENVVEGGRVVGARVGFSLGAKKSEAG